MNEYTLDNLEDRNWPKLTQTTDFKWQRIWEIELTDNLDSAIDLKMVEEELSNHEIRVKINVISSKLSVFVVTDRWGWDDDLIGYSYKILGILENRLGDILTIQGQQKDIWPPWFWKKRE